MSSSRPPLVRALFITALVFFGIVAGTVGATSPVAGADIDTSNTTNDITDSAADTTDDATNTTESPNESAGYASTTDTSETLDTTTETGDNTTTAVDDTTEPIEGQTESTVDNTTETVNETSEAVSESATEAVETTTDEVNKSITGVVASVNETVQTTDRTTNTTFGLVDSDLAIGVESSGDGAVFGARLATGETSLSTVDRGVVQSIVGTADGSMAAESSDQPTITTATSEGIASKPGGRSGEDFPPLPAGVAALGGIVVVTAAGRQCLMVAHSSPPSSVSVLRHTRWIVSRPDNGGWLDWVWRILGLLGYQRYDDSDPLEHDSRATIHDVLHETPGAYLSEISDKTDIPLSTVRYHLKILEHENLVARTKMRGKRRYFPAGTEPSDLIAALDDDGSGAVLRSLASHGPDSVSGLAEKLDRDVSTVSYHLQQLAEDGLVEREHEGPAVVNRLPPVVREMIDRSTGESMPADGPVRASTASLD